MFGSKTITAEPLHAAADAQVRVVRVQEPLLNWLLSHLTVRNDTVQIIIRSRFLAISSCEQPSRRGAAADVSLSSVPVHLNDEAPFSFKVTLPESSTLVSEPALNLEEGTASFEFKFGGVSGDIKVACRLFFCADAGQCVSEGVDFFIPVHNDGSATTHTVNYEYDIETKKKFTIF